MENKRCDSYDGPTVLPRESFQTMTPAEETQENIDLPHLRTQSHEATVAGVSRRVLWGESCLGENSGKCESPMSLHPRTDQHMPARKLPGDGAGVTWKDKGEQPPKLTQNRECFLFPLHQGGKLHNSRDFRESIYKSPALVMGWKWFCLEKLKSMARKDQTVSK